MFYYVLLGVVFTYFFFLFDHWRLGRHTLSENDRVLLTIALAVTMTFPLLGLFHLSWLPTLTIMAASGALYARHEAVLKRFRPADWHQTVLCSARLPIIWAAVSITGLFSWAWFW